MKRIQQRSEEMKKKRDFCLKKQNRGGEWVEDMNVGV